LALTVTLSFCLHWLIEEPARRYGKKLADKVG